VLGVLVAVCFLCVLVSTVLGGPTIQSAFLPLPAAPSPENVVAQHPKPVATGSTTSDPAQPSIAVVASTPVALPSLVLHYPPDVHFGADLGHICHDEGEGQADGPADTHEPADQDRTMTPGARCDPSL